VQRPMLPVVAFPYDVLITGAATLIAGVSGGVGSSWLIGRQTDRRDKQQRRLSAYSDFMLRLDELTRGFGAYETFADAKTDEKLGRLVNPAIGAIQVAYFAVYLSGSKDVQPLAGKAWQAAWAVHDWFNPPDVSKEPTIEQLSRLVDDLRSASTVFADAARKEMLEPRHTLITGSCPMPAGGNVRHYTARAKETPGASRLGRRAPRFSFIPQLDDTPDQQLPSLVAGVSVSRFPERGAL
jgi:hypothetical protein